MMEIEYKLFYAENKELTQKQLHQLKNVLLFLQQNGWEEDVQQNGEYHSFFHKYNYGINISKEDGEIVVIAEMGDIFHIQLTYHSLYTLVGFLVMHPCDDISLKYKF